MGSEYQLAGKIVELSEADTWDRAKLEWYIEAIYWEEMPDTCLCGHFPINEMCILRNRVTGAEALVGNVCVRKFMGLPSDKIFDAVKRIADDETRALNVEAIAHARERGWINEWQKNFYIDTWRNRILSAKQLDKRIQINRLVLKRVRNAR